MFVDIMHEYLIIESYIELIEFWSRKSFRNAIHHDFLNDKLNIWNYYAPEVLAI